MARLADPAVLLLVFLMGVGVAHDRVVGQGGPGQRRVGSLGTISRRRRSGLDEEIPGFPCAVRTRCSRRQNLSLTYNDLNCFCDDLCVMHGDCCKDYPGLVEEDAEIDPPPRTVVCRRVMDIDQHVEIYIVDSCPKDVFVNDLVRMQCESETPYTTGSMRAFLNIPVYGENTQLLYKNYYCALCGGTANVTFWRPRVECADTPRINASISPPDWLQSLIENEESPYFCSMHFDPGNRPPRQCKSNIGRCQKSYKDRRVKKKCRGPAEYVYIGKEVFHNRYCALCNHINESYFRCADSRTPRNDEAFIRNSLPPFSMTLNIQTGSAIISEARHDTRGTLVTTQSQTQVRTCPSNMYYDPFTKACLQLLCDPADTPSGGVCLHPPNIGGTTDGTVASTAVPTSTEYVETTTISTTTTTLATTGVTESAEVMTKSTTMLLLTPAVTQIAHVPTEKPRGSCGSSVLNHSAFVLMDNSSVLVISTGRLYAPSQYQWRADGVYLCPPMANLSSQSGPRMHAVHMLMFEYNSRQSLAFFVGTLVSLASLFILAVVYLILRALSDIASRSVLSLAISLFTSQLLLLVGVSRTDMRPLCIALGALTHYTLLASFCWISVLAYDACRRGPRPTNGDICTFVSYSFYAWLVPAVIVGCALALDLLDIPQLHDSFRPHYGHGLCWILTSYALLLFLGLPAGVLVSCSLVLYIIVLRNIWQGPSRGNPRAMTLRQPNQDTVEITVSRLVGYLGVAIVMGATWACALAAAMTEVHVLWYVFIAFHTLQGVLLYGVSVCNKRVFRLIKTKGRVTGSDDIRRNGAPLYFTDSKIIDLETSI